MFNIYHIFFLSTSDKYFYHRVLQCCNQLHFVTKKNPLLLTERVDIFTNEMTTLNYIHCARVNEKRQ